MWIVSVHFPHSDNAIELFESALLDLVHFLKSRSREHAVVAGDWNASDGGHRALLLDSAFSEIQFLSHRSGMPTRFGAHSSSELDYFFTSSRLLSIVFPDSLDVLVDTPEARLVLGSDHAAVSLHAAIRQHPVRRKLYRAEALRQVPS